MGKKVREYKSGDFIFAKVKGYPAWPARVQRPNGKKYFVYFYGTGETANLPPNMIFDYAENKDKFLYKAVKRRDFNDGVKQIEYDFANNVPLEEVIGVVAEGEEPGNETVNEGDETVADTTAADETIDESPATSTQHDTSIEDSDETGGLVIDEAKAKSRKSTAKTPAKEPPKPKEVKTPKGKGKKEEEDKEEELVSRSGRKIRPKRYMDEHTEENSTLPSPAPKKRRGTSPTTDKGKADKGLKHFNVLPQNELEDLKEPVAVDDSDKANILIAYLPSGQYVGIKLFESRPTSFKTEAARLQWDKQQATNAITLKLQLEREQITPQSVAAQLIMDLSLTDEEKSMLDKERETEEKRSRLQFLKTEVKMMELDAKIKTCLCLEKADTEMCLKHLDEFLELDVKPLMLLKHPTCLETIKRMRAYIGNTSSWDLSESAALIFSKHAHRIRKQADTIYNNMKKLFSTPDGLSFWEYFSERVSHFKKVTTKMAAEEIMEMVFEPIEMSQPTSHTMKSSVETANEIEAVVNDGEKKKKPAGKAKKVAATPTKTPVKRQNSKKQVAEKEEEKSLEDTKKSDAEQKKSDASEDDNTESENPEPETDKDESMDQDELPTESNIEQSESDTQETENTSEVEQEKAIEEQEELKEVEKESESDKDEKKGKKDKEKVKDSPDKVKEVTEKPKVEKTAEKRKLSSENTNSKEPSPNKDEKNGKDNEKDEKEDEPKAKRTRESKKTEPPQPRTPTKRKSKA
ncbi:unnamed protein product [Leptosia nina]|uniref:PWWP domain-containing protein n=1 Tax=Leptosia nina TaxID=320188 RepID=A0AAV1JLL2_9NEOP